VVAVTAAAGVVLLLDALATEAVHPLLALLGGAAVAQALVLPAAWTARTRFLVFLLSSVHVAGAAFRSEDGAGLAATLCWCALLALSLGGSERERAQSGARLRAPEPGLRPGADVRAAGAVWVLGLLLGTLLFVAAPRGGGADADPSRRASSREATEQADGDAVRGEPRTSGVQLVTGVDRTAQGIRLGDVGQIKRDLTPFLSVRSDDRPGDLRELYLRGSTADTFADGAWVTGGRASAAARWSDADDGKEDGWIELLPASPSSHSLEITFLEGLTQRKEGWSLLFLESEAEALRVRRPGGPSASLISETKDLKRFVPWVLIPGDLLEERVLRQDPPESALLAAASDAGTALSEAHLHVPEPLAPLRRVALEVVGAETSPWRRQQLLVRWFRERFRYTLALKDMGPPRGAVLEFVTRVREGHCEYFATAMALMLRSLGHPTRVAFGFRGGDLQAESDTLIVRGANAHLWPEMHLQGIGWVALEPTPPDREATDVVRTVAGRAGSEGTQGSPGLLSLLRGAVGREALARIGDAVAFLFGSRSGFSGAWALLLLAVVAGRRRRARAQRRLLATRSARAPTGAFGRALLLLAKRGIRRRRSWTAQELTRAASARAPRAGAPLRRIAALYEIERFGGRALRAEESRAGEEALGELARGLSPE
jgi:transglutaminase-like putative cysteine protease